MVILQALYVVGGTLVVTGFIAVLLNWCQRNDVDPGDDDDDYTDYFK